MRHAFLAFILALMAATASAEPTATQLELGRQYAELLQVRVMFTAYLTQCSKPEGSTFDPKAAFKSSPGSFGGLSPQSSYWPEVEAIYHRFQLSACAYVSADRFASYFAEQFATRNTEDDLRSAVAFLSSPAGQRVQANSVAINESFQKFANEMLLTAYRQSDEQYQVEIKSLMLKYRAEPR